jgi:hypothetical protein
MEHRTPQNARNIPGKHRDASQADTVKPMKTWAFCFAVVCGIRLKSAIDGETF